MTTLHGYNSSGPDTYGAAYARAHPDDLPDGFVPGCYMQYTPRLVLRTGQKLTLLGIPCTVVAGKQGAAVVLDTRKVDAPTLERKLPTGRLLKWKGLYWHVHSTKGVFVQLDLWGTARRRQGYRLFTRDGVEYAAPVKP